MAEITTPQGDKLIVHPEGGKIELWLHNELILGSFSRGDGKQGMTHPCTPIFGPDRNNLYGLKQHGNTRNEQVAIKEENGEIIVEHTITDEGYPTGVKVEQRMRLEDGTFHFTMKHTNTGEKEAAINAGEHCYFDAPEGFAYALLDDEDLTGYIQNNWDGAPIALQEQNKIQIKGKPEITISVQNMHNAMLWVGKNPETKEIDSKYICIEPVENDPNGTFFGSPDSMLQPGSSRSCSFTLKI